MGAPEALGGSWWILLTLELGLGAPGARPERVSHVLAGFRESPGPQAGCVDRRRGRHLPTLGQGGILPICPAHTPSHRPRLRLKSPLRAQQPPLPETRQHPVRTPGCQARLGLPLGSTFDRTTGVRALFCDALRPTGATGAAGMRGSWCD